MVVQEKDRVETKVPVRDNKHIYKTNASKMALFKITSVIHQGSIGY